MSDPSLRRLAKDVAELARNPLDDSGIFYYHHEDDIRKATAVIRGPEDSLYQDGYYVFSFEYPTSYPLEPPKVTLLSRAPTIGQTTAASPRSDGRRNYVRLHPNLYVNGKVCLSMLGTWPGEPWTSCCTIRILLVVMQSILDGDPYMNEPNVRTSDPSHAPYNMAIKFHNLYDGLVAFRRSTLPKLPAELQARVTPHVTHSVGAALARLRAGESELPSGECWVQLYSFGTRLEYDLLIGLLGSLEELAKDKLTGSVSTVSA
jgi:ubiquitin-protein ligase